MSYEGLLALDEDVPKRGLTAAQVSKLKGVVLKKGSAPGEDCTICLDACKHGEKLKKLPCGHLFHTQCISKWFKDHVVCPLCRFDCLAMRPAAA